MDTGNQTIAGIKTFSSIPLLPASDPTTANQAARKTYVDSLVSKYNRGTTTGTAIENEATTDTIITHGLGAIPKLIVVKTIGKNNISFGSATATDNQGCMYIAGSSTVDHLQDATHIAHNTQDNTSGISGTLTAISSTTFTIQFASADFGGNDGTPIFDWEVYLKKLLK